MNSDIRPSVPGDEDGLKALWKTVFGDEDGYINSFFELLYKPGMARVSTDGDRIVSAAHILSLGELTDGDSSLPCSVIYALATLPEYRGQGRGRRVLEDAVKSSSGPTLIVPAEPSLFDYYKSSGFTAYFNAVELSGPDTGEDLEGSVTHATVRGYAALREELLRGVPHIDLSLPAIAFQERLCGMYGGALCYVVCGHHRCAAAVEVHDGTAVIPELITPSGDRRAAAMLICRAMGVDRFTLRSPVRPGEPASPFAMISPPPPHDTGLAWFGPAFD